MSHPGLKKTCISACPLGRQLANLFCLARAVAPFSKFKINNIDNLHASLPIGQVSMRSNNVLPDKRIYLSQMTGQDQTEPYQLHIHYYT